MKKLTLSIALILFTLIGYSQDFYRITNMTHLEYKNEEWVVGESMEMTSEVYMVIDGNKIKIAGTDAKYICLGDSKDTRKDNCTFSYWDAYDKDGDKCFVVIANCFRDPDPKVMAITIGYETTNKAIRFDLDPKFK